MRLVERQAHLDGLHALLGEAARGKGRIAALTGEAGAGKSALVQAFAASIGETGRVLWGACEDLATPEPLGPLQDLARGARWDLLKATTRGGRLAAFSESLDVFGEEGRANLLVIEDLHWADDATIDFVRFLGRRIHGSHILLLITARNDEAIGRARLRRALADVPADNVLRIDVPLLSEGAVAGLARDAGLDGEALYRATAGNAFYVMELLRAASPAGLPASISDAVLARAERLTAPARRVLDAASIFPRRANIAVISALLEQDCLARIEECAAAGMLTIADDACAFRHEIARRAVEAALAPGGRRALNARALAVLRESDGIAVTRLVHHAHAANDSAAVRHYAPAAGKEASRLGAHREAAEHFRIALAHANTFSLGERVALYERYAFECHLIGRMQQAIAAQSTALDLHRAGRHRKREGDCLRWLSRLNYLAGNRIAADDFARQAIEILEGLSPGPELAMAYSNLSHLAMLALRPDEALDHGEKALALARPEALDRPDILCHALNNVGSAIHWRDIERGRMLLDRSLAIALANDFSEHAARTYTNRGWLEFIHLADDQARTVLEAGIAYCIERDLDTWRDYMRAYLAEVHLRQGRWDEAAATAHLVIANEDAAPLARYPAVLVLAKIRTRRGDPAADLMAELPRYLEKGMELQRLAPYAALVAERAWLGLAEKGTALRLVDQARALAPDETMFPELIYWKRILTEDRSAVRICGLSGPYQLLFSGDWRSAAQAWAGLGAPYEQALFLLQGDHRAQHRALALFEELGARAAVERVRESILQRGVRIGAYGPRASTRSNPAGLTKRQMDVLRLLDQGRSNGEIASTLCVSVKTVDHHVSAILGKLEAKSRGEAAAIARSSGLIVS